MHQVLTAAAAAKQIRQGTLSSVELVEGCLARIESNESTLQAWAHLDRALALAQAEELDAIRRNGKPLGSLHGIPVALKDIIDTRDWPTECGSRIFRGRRPGQDAALVDRLRDAGAVILGKTVSTEFAFMEKAQTRNPHNPEYSPGGSSSGSAAAVAAQHTPLAIGTQTNGSVIRPASFCGVYGFKPTRGLISRHGVLQTSKTLDQIGVFADSLQDLAALTEALAAYDGRDPSSYPRPRPAILAGVNSEPPVEPIFAWLELPFQDRLSKASVAGFAELRELLGERVETLPLPSALGDLVQAQQLIHEYELSRHLDQPLTEHWYLVSDSLKRTINRGRAIRHSQYAGSLRLMESAQQYFAEFFKDYDAVLTPSAVGEAPKFDDGTGDPIFCTIWTLCGLPALTMPLLVGEAGLPIGVQLIGGAEEDARLMRTANWLLKMLNKP